MIAGPVLLALALAVHVPLEANPVCSDDPTLTDRPNTLPAPFSVNCTGAKEDVTVNGWRCDESRSIVDDPAHPRRFYDWVWVAKPMPPLEACDEAAELCQHWDGWTCRELMGKPYRRFQWQLTELTELPDTTGSTL